MTAKRQSPRHRHGGRATTVTARAASLGVAVSPNTPFRWAPAESPLVSIREPGGDGLGIHMLTAMAPEPNWGGIVYAMGDVVTVVGGTEETHENVLMATSEPLTLAKRLDEALRKPRRDLTTSLFDDGMTLRIEGDGRGTWTAVCRPVPMPGPGATWKTFPQFTFSLGVAAMQRAIGDLEVLSGFFRAMEAKARTQS